MGHLKASQEGDIYMGGHAKQGVQTAARIYLYDALGHTYCLIGSHLSAVTL